MPAARWRIEVDRGACVGSGQCAALAPAAFRLDPAHKSRPVAPEADASEEVRAAAEGCPVEAIAIRVAGTGERVFPEGG